MQSITNSLKTEPFGHAKQPGIEVLSSAISADFKAPAAECIKEKTSQVKHSVKIFSSNHDLNGDINSRVMDIFSGDIPGIEYYSACKAFLHFSDLKFKESATPTVQIGQTKKQVNELPVTVGIGPTKTLAKLANRLAKRMKLNNGVHCLSNPFKIQEVLDHSKIGEVWGVGRHFEKLLLKHHVRTAADFIKLPEHWVRKNMSVIGQRMLNELCGMPSVKWEDQPSPRKGMCASGSFGEAVTGKPELQEVITGYATIVALQLRKQHSRAGRLQVFILVSPVNTEERLYKSTGFQFSTPTSNTNEMIRYALKGVDIIYRPGFIVLKAGVMVTGING